MSGDLNRATLIGRLGADPDVRATAGGRRVASFSLATGERWKDKVTGEQRERTEWHRVVIWNDGLVGIAERYLKKGARVMVEGEITTREYQDKDGATRKITEIVLNGMTARILLLDRAGFDRAPEAAAPPTSRTESSRTGGRDAAPPAPDLDDEIPF